MAHIWKKMALIVAQTHAMNVNVQHRIASGVIATRGQAHFPQNVAMVGISIAPNHQPLACQPMVIARHITMPVAIQAFAPVGPATVAILRAAIAAYGMIADVRP